jgi:hypothetical protein
LAALALPRWGRLRFAVDVPRHLPKIPHIEPLPAGRTFMNRNLFCLGEFSSWVSGLRKTARHAMHYLSPADAFLVVATLGTAVLIEIAAFIQG